MSGSGHSRLLKILHIDPERSWGGGEAQVFGLLAYLAAKGHRNDLLTHPTGPLFARCQDLNVTTFPLKVRNDLDLRDVPALRRLIKNGNYDIVHLHTKRAHALSLWLPRSGNRLRWVVTRRMDYPESKSWYTNYLYNRRVDGVVAISRIVKDLLIRAGVKPGKIRLIHSGIDPQRYERQPEKPLGGNGATVVGCLAGLQERKGHRFLLQAAALLKSRGLNLRYQIAGDGPLRQQLEQLTGRLGLGDEVRFVGFVADTAQFLAKIDLFVMPSLSEGLGVAALEAMAAGKAVIATSAGGLAESVLDGVTGILVPPQDPTALAHAIAKLVRAPSLAGEMGTQGQQRVMQHFTLAQMAQRNESFYYELLDAVQ
ncbi:MAG TPA: glycosyltransferase family 4 protein [Candidatus Binatia bacterium]